MPRLRTVACGAAIAVLAGCDGSAGPGTVARRYVAAVGAGDCETVRRLEHPADRLAPEVCRDLPRSGAAPPATKVRVLDDQGEHAVVQLTAQGHTERVYLRRYQGGWRVLSNVAEACAAPAGQTPGPNACKPADLPP